MLLLFVVVMLSPLFVSKIFSKLLFLLLSELFHLHVVHLLDAARPVEHVEANRLAELIHDL